MFLVYVCFFWGGGWVNRCFFSYNDLGTLRAKRAMLLVRSDPARELATEVAVDVLFALPPQTWALLVNRDGWYKCIFAANGDRGV